jgi:hypothetical protein
MKRKQLSVINDFFAEQRILVTTGHGHHSGPCGSVRVSCDCYQFHLVVSRDTDTWLLPRDGERRCGGWAGTSAAEL